MKKVVSKKLLLVVAGALVGLLVISSACSKPLAADAFTIEVAPIGHWHVFSAKKVEFTVSDAATEQGKAELSPVVRIHQVGSERVTVRSLEDEQITDRGDGVYSMEYTPSSIGGYAMVFEFSLDGQIFVSSPVAFDVAKAGEEGIRVESGGQTYVYQIRYNWEPGHPHANDTDKLKLSFEIMRGVEEGEEINWEQPYLNRLRHLADDVENIVVLIESDDGTVSNEIHPAYLGKGIYEAERVFSEAEVGHDGMDYHVSIIFTDPYNGAEVQNTEHFELHVVPDH